MDLKRSVFFIFLVGFSLFFASSLQAQLAEELYQNHCLRCHGVEGNGKGPAHTNLRPWPRNFQKGSFKFRSTPIGTLPTVADLERVISKGILRSSMPPFENLLTEEEIRVLALYTLNLAKRSEKKEGKPVPLSRHQNRESDVKNGEVAYHKLGCVQCHGYHGQGLGPAAGNTRDEDGWWMQPTDLTDSMAYGGGSETQQIYKHLKTGLGSSSMPHYGETVADQTLWQLARYLKTLQVSSDQREPVSREKWNQVLPEEVRGEYLTRSMACGLCHTNYRRDGSYREQYYLAGGVRFYIPGYGTIYMRNLTSDKETGIGNWTKQQIIDSIKQGQAPDRQLDALGMPWPFFYHLNDSDVSAIAAYLQTLEPIKNKVPDRKMDPIWSRLYHRVKQLLGLEYGHLEYWAGNAGKDEVNEKDY